MVIRSKFKKLFYLFFVAVYYFTSSIMPVSALKLPKGRAWEFTENDIVFYNPDGKKTSNCLSPDRDCQTSDGSDISVVGDGFLGVDIFKKELKTQFSKIDTTDTNYNTVSNITFDNLVTNLNTKTYKKNLILSYGTESNSSLTKEQINQLILAAGSSKTIYFLNNYNAGNTMVETNKNIEDASKTYSNVKMVDLFTKASQDSNYISSNKLSNTGAKDLVNMLKSLLDSGCSGVFTKYNFTDGQLRGITIMAHQENGLSPPTSILTEVSQMANIFESSQMSKYNSYSSKEQGFIDMLLKSGWYSSRTTAKYSESANVAESHLSIVKEALNSGKRSLPTGIVEHDSINDITSITNDGIALDKNNKSNYISKKTIIKNKFGSTYVFYQWADPNAPDNKKGDPFGYFQGKGPGDLENSIGSSSSSSASSIKSTGPSSDPNVVVTSDFKNYAGDTILTPVQVSLIEKNSSIYKEAAKEAGIPWQMLAVLHYREHSLLVSNPSNGQGIYQLYSYTNGGTNGEAFLPAGDVSEQEFLRQSKIAAKIIKDKAPDLTENPNSNIVKRAFYRYNGAAYKQQALDMGFSAEQADNGEGSPYVMSRADAKRDSTKGGMTWTMYTKDNQISSNINVVTFGAYIVYLALGGITDNSGSIDCLNSSSSYYSGGGNAAISKTALELAWHHYDTDSLTKSYFAAEKRTSTRKTGTAKYQDALRQVNNVGDQSDCGRFVSTVLRSSGVDPNFPSVGTSAILSYLKNQTSLYEAIPNTGDTSILQSGDILSVPGHIKLVVSINGKLQEVQASLNGHAPETSDGIGITDNRGKDGKYYIFRKK